MKGLIECAILIIIALIALMIYIGIKAGLNRKKYSKIISLCKGRGYKHHSSYSSKGNGIIYSKEIEKEVINALLLRYKYTPIEINAEYKVYDYIAIIKFPEWEERGYGYSMYHGGIRLFHFYSLKIIKGDKIYSRPFNHYLDNDVRGELLEDFTLKNEELIGSILTSNIPYIIQEFNDDEIKYWKSKTT